MAGDVDAREVREGGGVEEGVAGDGRAQGAEDAGGREEAVEEDHDVVALLDPAGEDGLRRVVPEEEALPGIGERLARGGGEGAAAHPS